MGVKNNLTFGVMIGLKSESQRILAAETLLIYISQNIEITIV